MQSKVLLLGEQKFHCEGALLFLRKLSQNLSLPKAAIETLICYNFAQRSAKALGWKVSPNVLILEIVGLSVTCTLATVV